MLDCLNEVGSCVDKLICSLGFHLILILESVLSDYVLILSPKADFTISSASISFIQNSFAVKLHDIALTTSLKGHEPNYDIMIDLIQ